MLDSMSEMSLPQALDAAAATGVETVEIPTGNLSPEPHANLGELTASASPRRELARQVSSRGLTIDSFNWSGNQFHPKVGLVHSKVVEDTIRLAGEFGLGMVVLMPGLPAVPGDSMPNWITSAWPAEITHLLDYQ